MNKKTVNFSELTEMIRSFAKARDWEQFHAPKNLAMALSAEAGELLEPFLWCETQDSHKLCENPDKRAAISGEIADVLIYALRLSDVVGIDPVEAILAKLECNERRYPVHKSKGSSAKYSEL